MKEVKRKETIGNGRLYLTRSKKRQEEAASLDEKDLISRLPLDLKLQILVKLPAKSIAKFIFVSKLWSSIARGKDLTELFISRSLARPRFLFQFTRDGSLEFNSYSQEEPFSRHVTRIAPETISCNLSSPIRGLICSEEIGADYDVSKAICNPSTGQFAILPRIKTKRRPTETFHFLGYDPVNDAYKVLCTILYASPKPGQSEEHQVFTLGAKKKAWRMIECNYPHLPITIDVCRDGVVYYGACHNGHKEESVIMSFDVRSEDFSVIKLPAGIQIRSPYTDLVNIHGNIALVDISFGARNVDLWVLQDLKKLEWSKISVILPDIAGIEDFNCMGTIGTGEIVFTSWRDINSFFILYYDLKRNNFRSVNIEGVRESGDCGLVQVFLDHVESPMFLQKEV